MRQKVAIIGKKPHNPLLQKHFGVCAIESEGRLSWLITFLKSVEYLAMVRARTGLSKK